MLLKREKKIEMKVIIYEEDGISKLGCPFMINNNNNEKDTTPCGYKNVLNSLQSFNELNEHFVSCHRHSKPGVIYCLAKYNNTEMVIIIYNDYY